MNVTKLKVRIPASSLSCYQIVFGENHWQKTVKDFVSRKSYSHAFVLTDEQVYRLWKKEINFFSRDVIVIPAGESSKTIEQAVKVTEKLLELGGDRKSVLIAMGGGVVGDLGGFVASMYMRGIDFIQIPTTVLAMVDSSIGGKTGVDTSRGKNLIGAFHFPSLVVTDTAFLRTLPEEQKRNGLVEMVKHALIADVSYYDLLVHSDWENMDWSTLLWKSCFIKASVVAKDPREQNLRQILNFGHTLGHAIEHVLAYELLHGFAVAWGMLGEVYISMQMGLLKPSIVENIANDFRRLNILQKPNLIRTIDWKDLEKPLLADKKNTLGQVKMVLLQRPGEVAKNKGAYSFPVQGNLIQKAVEYLQNIAEEIDEAC
ncbi:3-dehydroquinate synthase [Thermospira aquatica]|uniref:3-dehydroquinate synthase n=1 Tax=Thermospira aquatica TaxID=2828656 RepID=A0AAX3BCN9_9SPIR|nr:3-dehydroquinate synthase [Thermospira aquatica]URA09873.1 3-dehydroquinate synthase [Thermospira aquatica]